MAKQRRQLVRTGVHTSCSGLSCPGYCTQHALSVLLQKVRRLASSCGGLSLALGPAKLVTHTSWSESQSYAMPGFVALSFSHFFACRMRGMAVLSLYCARGEYGRPMCQEKGSEKQRSADNAPSASACGYTSHDDRRLKCFISAVACFALS